MSKRILVVDDDDAVRKSFELALRSAGYEVDCAASGDEGLACLARAAYDLVYLDLRMPGKDGVQVLREIRADAPDLPVYIVTAFHREFFDALAQAQAEGLEFEVLCKPLERDQIVRITRGITDGPAVL